MGMRREVFRMERADALALLQAAPVIHLASDGPILRTVHGVICDDALCFHAAPAGEKLDMLGREVVASAEEMVAELPSYFVDPERACPATTLYRSVQLHARLEPVEDAAAKARALTALMRKFQPEGGHLPIDAEHPLYAKAVRGVLIARMSLERLDGKAKLLQNRSPEERAHIVAQLWRRGRPGDLRAIELIRAANPDPRFLDAPAGITLSFTPRPDEAARLLEGLYWNEGIGRATLARSHAGASAWIGALDDASGALIGCARAMSDGAKLAWIYDVLVVEKWRGRGVASAMVRALLDHPALRRVKKVRLHTRDAQPLYARFGFREVAPTYVEMLLERSY
jgi:nitroimidazol reductase NimA-like FMN-containing flavoprotein (pyridoxamine 5'-phosphate oxidase superfamily)/GNAT superfamily N-acetyltransferase